MKRSLVASLFLVAMCAIASGSRTTSAAPASATAPQIGACRWFCNGAPAFKTEADCEKTCSHECEAVC